MNDTFDWVKETVLFEGHEFNDWTSGDYKITDRHGVFCAWLQLKNGSQQLLCRGSDFKNAEMHCAAHVWGCQ
jgi:hypothetical protein